MSVEHTVDSPVSNDGHAPNGRFAPGNRVGNQFAPGNKLGRGNPNARKIHELRQLFLEAINPESIAALSKRLQVAALQGDMDATKLLLDHCIGRPSQSVEVSNPDGSPLGRSAELSAALGAALSPFSEDVRFAVLGVIKRSLDVDRSE